MADLKPSVKLRQWRLTDAPARASFMNNKKVVDNLQDGHPHPYTEKDAEDFIRSVQGAEQGSQYVFAICVNDRVIGTIGAYRKKNIYRFSAEVGYAIAESYWGMGIATEAISQLCDFIFTHTDIVKLLADPFIYNIASQKALEKAGFTCEGVLHKHAFKNGEFIDMKLYAKVKE